MNVDLHMHTTCSDGIYTPAQLAAMAVRAGLGTIAISDHDTVAAYADDTLFSAGIRIIRAIEMSSEYDGEDVHILGYYINTENKGLQQYCRDFKERRCRRALEIADACIALGYALDRGEVEEILHKGGTVGRPHIARMLVKKGCFPDVKAVFETLLYRNGPAYVPYQRHTIEECIALIHEAGGLAFLAHPSLIQKGLAKVLTFPFDGIEVYHPKNRGRYDEFLAVAAQKGWMVSGGSDFHGVPGRFPEQTGVFSVPGQWVEPLLSYGK